MPFPSASGENQAYLAVFHHVREANSSFHRMIRLSDGATIDALKFSPSNSLVEMSHTLGSWRHGPGIFSVEHPTGEGHLWAAFNPASGWDFKNPWTRISSWCNEFALAGESPVVLLACQDGIQAMKDWGSSSLTLLPESASSAVGAGNHGVAVWAQHLFEAGRGAYSRIRAWSPEDDLRTIAEVAGAVCGLAVARNHVAGIRGEGVPGPTCRNHPSASPRFFWVSEDGTVSEGPVLAEQARIGGKMWTTADYTAATVVFPSGEAGGSESTHVILVRHADGKMRRFSPPSGYQMAWATVALDDESLYFTRWSDGLASAFDRVLRYRLDRFDEIGTPHPPEGD